MKTPCKICGVINNFGPVCKCCLLMNHRNHVNHKSHEQKIKHESEIIIEPEEPFLNRTVFEQYCDEHFDSFCRRQNNKIIFDERR